MNRVDVLIGFITENNFKKVAEIGIWNGRTAKKILASNAGKILDEYWGIDPYKILNPERENAKTEYGKMAFKTQDDWNEMHESVRKLCSSFPKLQLLRLSSINAAKIMNPQYFDLIFIDGDHYYEDVKIDLESWYPLVKNNGIICGHDYGAKWHPGVKTAVDEFFERVDLYPDNVWVVRKKE